MTLTVKSFVSVLAVAALPFSAMAQESSGTAAGDLAIGTPESQIGSGDTYVKEEFGDWQFRCIRTEGGEDPCQLYQLLRDAGDNPVAEISIFTVSGNEKIIGGATIVTPLETLLTAGSARVDAQFFAAAHRAAPDAAAAASLAQEAAAWVPTAELLLEAEHQGDAFLATVRRWP